MIPPSDPECAGYLGFHLTHKCLPADPASGIPAKLILQLIKLPWITLDRLFPKINDARRVPCVLEYF
jgi:hypothetical protein